MPVVSVTSRRQWREFVDFPYRLYDRDPLWIPPPRGEQRKLFRTRSNPYLRDCPHILLLAMKRGEVRGRVAAFLDPHYQRHWGESIGFFGSYEAFDEADIAAELLRACEKWLCEQGIERMRGPVSFESQNWGAVVQGYDDPPRLMSPYNPPYVHEHYLAAGLTKVKDLEIYAADSAHYAMPPRFTRRAGELKRRYSLTLRPLEMRHMERDVRIILDLSNRALSRNWGYVPVSIDEARAMARELRRIVDPNFVVIVESNGSPVAFVIALPDILPLFKDLNGRLFPRGYFRLLFRRRNVNLYRIWALGVVPEFQRRAVDTLMYLHLHEILRGRSCRLEANYVLEDNHAMKSALIKLGMEKVRICRIYEKVL